MAKLGDLLTSALRPTWDRGHPPWRRALAVALAATLLLANLAPAVAAAAEFDSEAEGNAPPGAVEGAPDVEVGGEEAALEEATGSPPGGTEDTGEGPPLEAEPQTQPEAPTVASPQAVTAAPPASAQAPQATEPPSKAQAPAVALPTHAPSPPAPEAVANQPLAAPPAPPSAAGAKQSQGGRPAVEAPPRPAPTSPPASPEAPASQQPATLPAGDQRSAPDLAGRATYTVRPGDCLWSIAKALLTPGASEAQIAREVKRLWRLNAVRIGTGDPSLLAVGTVLALR